MEASVRLDHMLVAVESANAVHAMVELAFPEAPATGERPPLHVALVLDRSGSMAGDKLETTKACAAHLVQRLRADDELAVIAYDDEVTLVAPLQPVKGDALAAAIEGIWPGGSTNLSGGWLKGVEELGRSSGDGRRAVLLLTDGLANVGVTDPARLVEMATGAKRQGATTSTIGFGADFDEDLLTRMADAGGGNAHYAPTPEAAPAIFAEEFEGLSTTVAQNVSLEIRPSDEVELVSVLHDYPITPVPGGVQLALGDAWGGERRRIVFRLGVPAVAELGPKVIADVVLRWVDVTGEAAMHKQTIPVIVNTVAGDEAANEVPDAEVVEEVVVLKAAEAEREARRRADEGDFPGAQSALRAAAKELRDLAPNSARAAELLARASEVHEVQAMMAPGSYDAAIRKDLTYRSSRASRRRR